MKRFNLYFFIAFISVFITACTAPSEQTEGEPETTEAEEPVAAEESAPASFEVRTLNDGIPSPRRELTATIDGVSLAVNYGSPSVKGRELWGGLVPYGEVWRTGANEATTFEVDQDVNIAGKTLPAGKYGLFTIPGESDWTLIFNKTADQWGAYEYKEAEDAMRVKVNPGKSDNAYETMEFLVEDNQLVLVWGEVKVPMAIKST